MLNVYDVIGGMILSSKQRNTVLVVDDDRVSLEFAVAVFQRHGCDTLSARTAPLALELAKRHEPELVVLDIQIPTLDGLQLMRRILVSGDRHCKPVFVALTGETRPSRHAWFLRSGFFRVLTKPATAAQLLNCLDLDAVPAAEGFVYQTTASTGTPALQQKSALQALDGDRALLAKFRLSFGRELNMICPRIDQHIVLGELGEAAKLVHRLSATAAYCGAQPLQNCCKSLEAALDAADVPEMADHYSQFLLHCRRLSYSL